MANPTARTPKWFRDLEDRGYDYALFRQAYRFFDDRGFTIGYNDRRKQYCIMQICDGGEWHTITRWMGVDAFVDCLNSPSRTIAEFSEEI